jgi:uncharacterized membrane-anchored protein
VFDDHVRRGVAKAAPFFMPYTALYWTVILSTSTAGTTQGDCIRKNNQLKNNGFSEFQH